MTAENTLEDADEQLTVTESRLADIDRAEMEDIDRVSLTKIEDALNELDEMMPAMVALTRGMKHYSRGAMDYDEAREAYDSEQYSTAETEFRDASDDFATASSIFKEQEDAAPQTMRSYFIELTCQSNAFKEGSQHLANAVEAIQNGNETRANEEADNAEEALNKCSS